MNEAEVQIVIDVPAPETKDEPAMLEQLAEEHLEVVAEHEVQEASPTAEGHDVDKSINEPVVAKSSQDVDIVNDRRGFYKKLSLLLAVCLTLMCAVLLWSVLFRNKSGGGGGGSGDGESETSEELTPHFLYQSDFDYGTLIIDEPGLYVVQEDIVFAPRTEKMFPPADSEIYTTENGYDLGFFAVIAVTTKDVTLDLNGHELSCSIEFSLRQRFFSIIELASRPFIAGTGPPQFTALQDQLQPATNFKVYDGVLGLSSHSAIHGNLNAGVEIRNVVIRDFETTGIQLNEASDVLIDSCDIGPALGSKESAGPVRALATLSQATLLLRLIEKYLAEFDDVKDAPFNTEVFAVLDAEVEAFIAAELAKEDPFEKVKNVTMFNDPELGYTGFMDGSAMYGVIFHKSGPAVNELANCDDVKVDVKLSNSLRIKNTEIHHISLFAEEVQALVGPDGKKLSGPDGGIVPIAKLVDHEGKYVGNSLSNAQFELQRIKNYYLESLNLDEDEIFVRFGGINVPDAVLAWQDGTIKTFDDLLQEGYSLNCGQDCMAHSNKGVIGLRIEFSANVLLEAVAIHNLTNNGTRTAFLPESCAGRSDYLGSDARGIVASVSTSLVTRDFVSIEDIYSHAGSSYGVEIRDGVSNTHYDDLFIENIISGIDTEHCHSIAVQTANEPQIDIKRRMLKEHHFNERDAVVDSSALGCPFLTGRL